MFGLNLNFLNFLKFQILTARCGIHEIFEILLIFLRLMIWRVVWRSKDATTRLIAQG
jgi:hypothetical protein